MKRSITIFTIGAFASLAAIHAGEECAAPAKQTATACAAVQKAESKGCCADDARAKSVAAKPAAASRGAVKKAEMACCAGETSITAAKKAPKRVKRAQATAKGGYRG